MSEHCYRRQVNRKTTYRIGSNLWFKKYIQIANRYVEMYATSLNYLLWSVTQLCWLFATPWTVFHQALLSMEFSRQEYWSGFPCLSPGDLSNPRIEPHHLLWQADYKFTTLLPGKPITNYQGNANQTHAIPLHIY